MRLRHESIRACVLLMVSATITVHAEEGHIGPAQNPMGHFKALYSENNTMFGLGPSDAVVNILNIKPVWPEPVENWNLVNRLILPVIWMEGQDIDLPPELLERVGQRRVEVGASDLSLGTEDVFGLGDITYQVFVARHRPGKFVWGIGPTFVFPTHTDELLGVDQWSGGVGGMLLTAPGRWVISAVAQNVWSFIGDDDEGEINQFWLEYILNYRLGNGWFIASSPTITANWKATGGDRWTIPLGGGIGRAIKSRDYPATFKLEAFWNAEKPQFAADWTLQATLNLLFPRM